MPRRAGKERARPSRLCFCKAKSSTRGAQVLTSWHWDRDRFWGRQWGPAARPRCGTHPPAPGGERSRRQGSVVRIASSFRQFAWLPQQGSVGSLSALGVRRPRPKPTAGAASVRLRPVVPLAPAPALGPEPAANGAAGPKRHLSAIEELLFFAGPGPTGSPPRPPPLPQGVFVGSWAQTLLPLPPQDPSRRC